MHEEDMMQLKAFFGKMKDDVAFQEAFKRHMGGVMRGMDADIMVMQRAMNDRIAQGFLSYARDAGFPVTDGEMDELLCAVSEGLHKKMGAIFQKEFSEAIGRMLK